VNLKFDSDVTPTLAINLSGRFQAPGSHGLEFKSEVTVAEAARRGLRSDGLGGARPRRRPGARPAAAGARAALPVTVTGRLGLSHGARRAGPLSRNPGRPPPPPPPRLSDSDRDSD
jgi:hypothetical protein